MSRTFNVNGICYPDEHYMVNIDSKLAEIKQLVDEKKYFVINRARQYGKTTTPYNPDNFAMDIGTKIGIIKEKDEKVAIGNQIFETSLINSSLVEELIENESRLFE